MLLGAGLMFYITSGQGKNILVGLPSLTPPAQHDEVDTATSVEDSEPDESAQYMVKINGKWHKYRADNTYIVDGVPTLHIAKKPPVAETPAKVPTTNVNLEKSQKLAKMAGENPLSVYTPEGFQALKDGLEAAKSSAAERKKALEELSKEH